MFSVFILCFVFVCCLFCFIVFVLLPRKQILRRQSSFKTKTSHAFRRSFVLLPKHVIAVNKFCARISDARYRRKRNPVFRTLQLFCCVILGTACNRYTNLLLWSFLFFPPFFSFFFLFFFFFSFSFLFPPDACRLLRGSRDANI